MNIILTIIGIAFFTFLLKIIIIQSNNFIFMIFRKPVVWIVFMGLLSFFFFFIGSSFDNSFNVIWWSALLAFVVSIPPSAKGTKIDQKERKQLVDEMYKEAGINHGALKYKLGLTTYILGSVLGWVIFYGEIISVGA